jgi:hypothetical protein
VRFGKLKFGIPRGGDDFRIPSPALNKGGNNEVENKLFLSLFYVLATGVERRQKIIKNKES